MGKLVADITMSLDGFITDELRLHVAPVLLGAGKRLFDHLGNQSIELERTRIVESPYATHLFFAVR